jgi:hypothetical protein
MKIPIPLTILAIVFWACVWASQCSSEKPKEEVGAIGPDPIRMQIDQIHREHEQGREIFERLQRDVSETKRKTDSIGYAVRELQEHQKFEAQLNALSKYPIRTDTPPCKPVPCYAYKGDTTRLYVPKKKH